MAGGIVKTNVLYQMILQGVSDYYQVSKNGRIQFLHERMIGFRRFDLEISKVVIK